VDELIFLYIEQINACLHTMHDKHRARIGRKWLPTYGERLMLCDMVTAHATILSLLYELYAHSLQTTGQKIERPATNPVPE
jgi:hypothetical protein